MSDATELKPCPKSPNCVCSQAGDSGHKIAPITYSGSPQEAWAKLRSSIEAMPRTRVVEATDSYLRAESVSRVLRFVDDLECVLVDEPQVIHVRSASRVGYSDFGVNRKRVDALREMFAT